jgi:uncharacterized protein (UPF0276 family)
MRPFLSRVSDLPHLGLGVSTEYGAARARPGGPQAANGLDVFALQASHPHYAQFLELGVELEKGLDDDARAWVDAGRATTYHFLDVNLDDDADFDDDWLSALRATVARAQPAWLCGDAGLWHFGARDRGHMLLLPPILVDDAATALARGVARLREVTGKEVLPENPPGTAFVGDLHVLEFFRRLCERADTGMLLDVAHLSMFQKVTGRDVLDGCADFCWDRVVEVHVAGNVERDVDGFVVVDDTHGAAVADDVWTLFQYCVAHSPNLKAVVFECERNTNDEVLAGCAQIASMWPGAVRVQRAG